MLLKSIRAIEFCFALISILSAWLIATACNIAYATVNVNQLVNDSAASIVQVQGIQWVKIKIPEQYKNITDDPVYRSLSSILLDNQTPNNTQAAPVIKKRINGSGFIISNNGQIATNYQWVKDTHEVIVTLWDARQFKASITRSDPKNDVALLRIRASNLAALSLAQQVEEGEGVIAIGAKKHGTSVGVIVSTPAQTPGVGLVSDVNVSPENSGGPLLNVYGQVLGINSTRMKTALNLFRHPMLGKLASDGFDTHSATFNSMSYIGFSAADMNNAQDVALGLPNASGAIVLQVRSGSMAAKAGLLKNDVIISLESQSVVGATDLSALPDFLRQDYQARLTVFRDGEKIELQLINPKPKSAIASWSWRKLGLRARPLSIAQKNATDINSGVLITEVKDDGLNNEVQAGDWIISINQVPLTSVAQLNQIAQNLNDGDSVVLYIIRDNARQFVSLIAHE
ncbi:MAG: htrA [Burkholderiaceae bacterium]|nr:htrA [Burkholderiaceae bacterium]